MLMSERIKISDTPAGWSRWVKRLMLLLLVGDVYTAGKRMGGSERRGRCRLMPGYTKTPSQAVPEWFPCMSVDFSRGRTFVRSAVRVVAGELMAAVRLL